MSKSHKSFAGPTEAAPIKPFAARAFLCGVLLAALVAAIFFDTSPLWPTPYPFVSTVILALLVAVTGAFGTFESVEGLAEYFSLAMPVWLASLLVLDWHHFVACVALGEFFQFISERTRRINPTKWYVRCYNVGALVVAGFGADTIVRVLWPHMSGAFPEHWGSPALCMALVGAAIAWQVLDEVQTSTLLTLAAELPLSTIEFSSRRFISHLSLLVAGVPLAFVWRENLFLGLLTLAPLSKGLGLLGVSELEHRGQTDARTGLFNAGRFDELLGEALEQAQFDGRPLALLIADIDHFKAINDDHGHLAGDHVIRQIAGVLTATSGATDVAARVGGEEFALILRGNDRDNALEFAERLRCRIAEEPFAVGDSGRTLSITTSVGVALYPTHAQTATSLYASADAALYEAKRSGRNRVCLAGNVNP
jgi:diguanylate cyclase (GGDEF)-like protein